MFPPARLPRPWESHPYTFQSFSLAFHDSSPGGAVRLTCSILARPWRGEETICISQIGVENIHVRISAGTTPIIGFAATRATKHRADRREQLQRGTVSKLVLI